MIELLKPHRVGWGAFYVVRRNLMVWRTYALASFIGAVIEPVLYLLAIGYGLGGLIEQKVAGMSFIEFLGPGLVASSVMYAASFEGTYGAFTRMTRQFTYEAIISTPVSINEVVAGDIYYSSIKSLIAAVAVLAVLTLFGLVHSPWAAAVPLFCVLVGLAFSSFAIFFTAVAPSYDFFNYYFTLLIAPMFLFSGIFFPIQELPAAVQPAVYFLPLTHAVEGCRALVRGEPTLRLLVNALCLAGFGFVFFVLSTNIIRKRIIL